MKGRNEVHIEGEGTDLTLEVGGRIFAAGRREGELPRRRDLHRADREQDQGPHLVQLPGDLRRQVGRGHPARVREGRVVEATAEQNEDFLIKTLDTDPGARILGELGIGTNYGIETFTGEILLDEKIGGTVHLAVGASYPESGGLNESAVHWDMVCDLRRGGRITVDGDTLMEDGKLLV